MKSWTSVPLQYFLIVFSILAGSSAIARCGILDEHQRVIFVGDSNTHAGQYIVFIETALRLAGLAESTEFLNIGLPSETVTGLSEPDHPFPRPNVHERLDRILAKTRPDVVFACYGINDGIYYPFDEKRFAQYQTAITKLVEKSSRAGAKVILVTPPPFDPLPQRKQGKLRPKAAEKFAWFAVYEDYDDVMRRYADWMRQQKKGVEQVIDVRKPLVDFTNQKRISDPGFSLSSDGVHFDKTGHKIIAETILRALGYSPPREYPQTLWQLVERRQSLMRDAWRTEIGHKRPGMKQGLPLTEAQQLRDKLNQEIDVFLQSMR